MQTISKAHVPQEPVPEGLVLKGLVLDIQRMSTEDGPGLRTTVFLKGCPLRCEWCHNPESISSEIQLEIFPDRCIGCGSCIENCSPGALSLISDDALSTGRAGVVLDTDKCTLCLECAENCPAAAIRVKGEYYTAETLAAELLKDRAYFGSSGGITVSGGEALFQPEFTSELCRLLTKEGINVAVDTCGLCSRQAIEMVLPYTDIFLYDIKLLDPAEHKLHTGADNKRILENLRMLAPVLAAQSRKLWLRTPIIPGATDSTENISRIAGFITGELQNAFERWELCAFNNLCTAKYLRFGIDWKYKDSPLQQSARLEELREIAVTCGISPEKVFVTGMTK